MSDSTSTRRQRLRRMAARYTEPRCDHGLPVSDCLPCADADERRSDWTPLWAEALDKAVAR